MNKKIVILLLVIFSVISVCVAFASQPIQIMIDGSFIYPDVPPQIIDGRTMVPLRVVAEYLGCNVFWDEVNRIVRVEKSQDNELYNKWYQEGYAKGYNESSKANYDAGYSWGYKEGYEAGKQEAKSDDFELTSAYNQGYRAGYNEALKIIQAQTPGNQTLMPQNPTPQETFPQEEQSNNPIFNSIEITEKRGMTVVFKCDVSDKNSDLAWVFIYSVNSQVLEHTQKEAGGEAIARGSQDTCRVVWSFNKPGKHTVNFAVKDFQNNITVSDPVDVYVEGNFLDSLWFREFIRTGSSFSVPKNYYGVADFGYHEKTTKGLQDFLNHFIQEEVIHYKTDVFDCSESAAFVEWLLENAGFKADIVIGLTPWDPKIGYHAWVIAYVEEVDPGGMLLLEKAIPIEATRFTQGKGTGIVEDQNYFKFETKYEDIYKAMRSLAGIKGEFNWWKTIEKQM